MIMKEKEKEIILDEIEKHLDDQEESIVRYMNEFMTQEERDRHGDNIWGYLKKGKGIVAEVNLYLMSKGF